MLPRWKLIFSIVIVTVFAALFLANIQLQVRYVPPRKNTDFNVQFRYGVTARNELNTFNNTYTKDMILDPPITVWLSLSDEEISKIKQQVFEIDFFSLPETVPIRADGRRVTPQTDFYLKVQNGSAVKEISWSTNSEPNMMEKNLSQLASLIETIVEGRPEFRDLPPANGGYC